MKVKDLIDLLSKQDADMRVVVDGYEAGFDSVTKIQLVNAKPNPDKDDKEKDCWWLGEYEECEPGEHGEIMVLIPRTS
jgi:hypothetical protein